jgi:hypothetical protein
MYVCVCVCVCIYIYIYIYSLFGNKMCFEFRYVDIKLGGLPFSSGVEISKVGKTTCYGLGFQGFEPRWGRDSSDPSRPAPRPSQPPVKWVTSSFPRGKVAGAWCVSPTPH